MSAGPGGRTMGEILADLGYSRTPQDVQNVTAVEERTAAAQAGPPAPADLPPAAGAPERHTTRRQPTQGPGTAPGRP